MDFVESSINHPPSPKVFPFSGEVLDSLIPAYFQAQTLLLVPPSSKSPSSTSIKFPLSPLAPPSLKSLLSPLVPPSLKSPSSQLVPPSLKSLLSPLVPPSLPLSLPLPLPLTTPSRSLAPPPLVPFSLSAAPSVAPPSYSDLLLAPWSSASPQCKNPLARIPLSPGLHLGSTLPWLHLGSTLTRLHCGPASPRLCRAS